MPLAIVNLTAVTPDATLPGATVLLDGDRIAAVAPGLAVPDGWPSLDAAGCFAVPGFIDLHVHGGGGYSCSTNDPRELRRYAAWVAATGVTAFLAGVVAPTPAAGHAALAAVAAADADTAGGARLLGAHLEGPFLNPARHGAFPPSSLRPPDLGELRGYLAAASGALRILTLAPELPGAAALVHAALDAGVRVSMGHSDATYDQALQALDQGLRHVTHCFNAMRPFHHRDPGIIAAALADARPTVELIADGVHVAPGALRLAIAAAGPGRVCLATDAIPVAGQAGGTEFDLGAVRGRVVDGAARLSDGTLAGSVATMAGNVRRLSRELGVPLADAVRMASTTPAAALGMGDRFGRLAPGFAADLVLLDADLRPVRTFVRGRQVWRAEGGGRGAQIP